MRAHRLIRSDATEGTPFLSDLIDDLGTIVFPSSLFRTMFAWAKPDHMTAFVFEGGKKPRVVFAENAGPSRVAPGVAEQYCRDYWRYDLANRLLHDTTSQGSWILQTSASEIGHSDYRQYCYTAVSLDHRITLSDTRGDRALRINLYRPKGDGFTDDEMRFIGNNALLLLALVRRHVDYRTSSHPDPHHHYRARLASVAPDLTSREADVCAAIIQGLTSEGIALELGVALNTVLTYKKRAYARLNISSQNQLMRLVLDG